MKTAQSQKHRLPAFIILPLLLLPLCILLAIESYIDSSIIKADTPPPAIMVDDKIYYCQGGIVDIGLNDVEILGYIDSSVPRSEIPKKIMYQISQSVSDSPMVYMRGKCAFILKINGMPARRNSALAKRLPPPL